MRTAAGAALLLVIAALAATTAYAAFGALATSADNKLESGTVKLSDNDGGQAMLGFSGAALGASDTSCIRATSDGSLASEVHHYGTVSGALAPYLNLKVTRGSGAAGFDDCTGFTPDSSNYVGAGQGVLYDGALSDYPSSYATGLVDPSTSGSPPYSSDVADTPGLVGYWRLGDTVDTVASDSFTDVSGTLLQNHTGETGALWTKVPGETPDAQVTGESRLRRNASGAATYYASGAPASADYSVEANVHVKTHASGDAVGVFGRVNTSTGDDYYLARYITTGAWQLFRVSGGIGTVIGSYSQTLSAGSTHNVKLDMAGSTIRVLVDGVQRISVTDTAVTAPGRAGVRLGYGGAPSVVTESAGLHADDFKVEQATTTATDSTGAHDGTYSGGVTLGADGALAGDPDTAAHFNGTSGGVAVPNSASLQISGAFSVETWIKPDSLIGTRYLVVKDGFASYYLYLIGSDIVFGFLTTGGVYAYVIAPGAATTGTWQHLAGSYNGSRLALYRNGVEVASAPASASLYTGTGPLFIGAVGTGFFPGAMDETAVYSRGLTAAEVKSHYAGRNPLESWTASESHDYKFHVTLDNDAAALGKSGTATFHWGAGNR